MAKKESTFITMLTTLSIVALISAGLLGSSHAMSHLTDILNYCGTHVLARKPRLIKIGDYIADGNLINESYLSQLKKQLKELINF